MFKASIAQEMLGTAAAAAAALDEGAARAMARYLLGQLAPGGGFRDRAGAADLYYTSFGLCCAQVLGLALPLDDFDAFLGAFEPRALTLVDLACLVRSRLLLRLLGGETPAPGASEALCDALEAFRTEGGAYAHEGEGAGSPYASFLAVGLCQDVGRAVPEAGRLAAALEGYRTREGRYGNPESRYAGALLSTAAAVTTLRHLSGAVDEGALDWIARQGRPEGGFRAAPGSPLPDLLSTAVAVFALTSCGRDLGANGAATRRFLGDHWHDCGGFTATLLDETCDCEYLFYGLLALGTIPR